LVWIDAICIDQEDEVERAGQVGLMGRIYMEAVHCAVYLGEDAAPELVDGRFAGRRELNSLSVAGEDGEGKHVEKRKWAERVWRVA